MQGEIFICLLAAYSYYALATCTSCLLLHKTRNGSILSEYYDSPFFFDSLAIKEQSPLLIELDKIYRQKEESFVRLLNKVRNNHMDADDFEDLHVRFDPNFRPDRDEKYITLTSHNKQADQINEQELYKLDAASFKYKAEIRR